MSQSLMINNIFSVIGKEIATVYELSLSPDPLSSLSSGANSTIIGGIPIGEYAMVGAGSVVTKDMGMQELWYGNPAKHEGYVCKCGEKCDEKLLCNTFENKRFDK